jgi:DNA primase
MFDNPLLISILYSYKEMKLDGGHSAEKQFLYHSDPNINQMAVSLLTEKHQMSPNWTKFYKGEIQDRTSLYKEEVLSCMTYLKLKKVKRLIVENQKDLETEISDDDMLVLLHTHKHLKEVEMELMKNIGTVIFR